MTSPSWLAVRVRRYSILPYATGAALVALSIAIAAFVQKRENADVHRAVALRARSLASLTMSRWAERNNELARIARVASDDHSVGTWRADALRLIETGVFRSLVWVDSSGQVVASVPDGLEARPAALRMEAETATRAAATTGHIATSAPVTSRQGMSIVYSAAPMARGAGAIVAESALPVVLQQALEMPEAAGYSVSVTVDGHELFSRASGPHSLSAEWGEDAPLGPASGNWRMRVWPTQSEVDLRRSRFPETMLVTGLLFAVAIAGMMRLYQTAARRAHDLSRANKQLESEISERERAQEALKLSEEQLRQSQKMEAVGRLAGGIAHDFNNLLTAIGGYSDFLLADIDRTDPRRDDVREIKKAATRAGALTAQLLAFSRRQIRQPRLLDLNAVLTDLEKMLRRVIGEDVRIVWRPSERLGSVMADPSEIEQVMLNLVVNAGDAMPNGGTVKVTTDTVTFEEGGCPARLSPGKYIKLSVADTGMGMDAGTRARIFEPFFTTKEPGKGTGLGLSTVYAIVENVRGSIEVESAVGQGTTFTVYLPQHEEAAEMIGSGTLNTLAPRGNETVLLVEDEDGVRALGSRILERHGYTVLEARNGRDAMSVVAQHSGVIDLLLTDVVMPEMGGKQLAETLTSKEPSLRVLYMSGYTDGDISRRGELDPCTAFLQKPFTARGLLVRVRDVLGGELDAGVRKAS